MPAAARSGTGDEQPVSAPGLRRWSVTGEPLWSCSPVPGAGWISDRYALTVAERTARACPYTGFPLIETSNGACSISPEPVVHRRVVHRSGPLSVACGML
ncbi:hypothetical protein J2Z21_004505 [Streptomyces griseochromogenes]|uniref:Uncharacterized protein n=1 Tax=Streptomyces griseochromogenes TaxID=68214 RepID=A0ABS4LVT0_9ACTN|nr:hypothetical protein [Streptomyces griseochromogenes]